MSLEIHRKRIDEIDEKLTQLFLERMQVSADIAAYKKEKGLPIRDPEREREAGLGYGKGFSGDGALHEDPLSDSLRTWPSTSTQPLRNQVRSIGQSGGCHQRDTEDPA